MAYDPANLACINPGAGKNSIRLFTLVTVDAEAAIDDSGYLTDGVTKGMRLGDLVFVWATDSLTAPTSFELEVWQCVAVSGQAATIAQSTVIT